MRRGILALLLLPGALRAGSLSLPEAMRQAARTSFRAEGARLERAKAREETSQIRSLYLPELHFQGGHLNLEKQPRILSAPVSIGPLDLGGITIPRMDLGTLVNPLGDTSSWRYKVSLQYLLYDFGRRERALAASRARETAIGLREEGGIRRTQAEVAQQYVGLMHLKAQRRVLSQRRKALEDHLKSVRALFEQGMVARNDLLRTEVALRSLGDAERALDSAESGARDNLNVAMGLEPTATLDLPDDLDAPPGLPWDETACRVRAAQSSEGVKALRARLKALESQVVLQRRDYAPNLVAEAFHAYEQNSYSVHPHSNGLYLGLSWKVFDGARASRVRQSLSEFELGRREVQEAERQAGNTAAAAYRDLQVALRELKTSEANVAAAEENFRIVEDQYREGLARSTDALDAEALLAESRFGLAARRYRAYALQAALLATLGEDLPAFYEHAKEPSNAL